MPLTVGCRSAPALFCLLVAAIPWGCDGTGTDRTGQGAVGLPGNDNTPRRTDPPHPAGSPSLGTFSPPSGWTPAGAATLFRGSELYGHIDGGAEVFLELGFDHLEVRHFEHEEDEVTVELYRMADPPAALGIYLMKCGREAPDTSLAERHTVNPYQLLMCKGTTFVTIINGEATREGTLALVPFARAVALQTPASRLPDPFRSLPLKGRVSGSERVIRGPFCLQEIVQLGPGDILSLTGGGLTAVAADYKNGSADIHSLIIAPYTTQADARAAFAHLTTNLAPSLSVLHTTTDRLVVKRPASFDQPDTFDDIRLLDQRLELLLNLSARPSW